MDSAAGQHWGYLRDAPDELPSGLVCGSATAPQFQPAADTVRPRAMYATRARAHKHMDSSVCVCMVVCACAFACVRVCV